MPETVDDFLQRFGGRSTVDDRQASQYYDRFASNAPQDAAFDSNTLHDGATEYLGKLPDQEFHQAAQSAYSRVEPQQRQSLVRGLLGALGGSGLDLGSLASRLGMRNSDPQRMDGDDYARLANYTRKEHPEVLRDQVRDKPWFMKALGNPIVMGALAVAAAKMLQNQTRGR